MKGTMGRPAPNGNEITFGFDELFFSTTNKQGRIHFGNDVFVRISGFERQELIGKPHSIIRHPDMPRIVFKTLWSYIQSGQPIAAYVKNLAADGSAYWVMAVVFPCGERFLSIRLRPSGPYFETVKSLYAQLLAEEERESMDASGALLDSLLADSGFPSYQRFMTAALMSELSLRDNALEGAVPGEVSETESRANVAGQSSTSATLAAIRSVSRNGWLKFRELSTKMEEFANASLTFQEMSLSLLASFRRIQVVSLNVTVFARQLGDSAVALSVISKEFHRMATDVERNTRELSTVIDNILEQMQRSSFQLASLKIQMDMVDFFVRESLSKISSGSSSIAEAFQPLDENCELFSSLSSKTSIEVAQSLQALRRQLLSFVDANEDVDRVVHTLEIIAQMAALESARVPSHQQSFASYLAQMEQFNSSLKTMTSQIKHFTHLLIEILRFVEDRLPEVTGTLDEILARAFSMKTTGGN